MTDKKVKQGVLEGYIPSAEWDTEWKYDVVMIGDPFIQTEQISTNIFALSDEQPTPATNIYKLDHRVQEPVHTVNIVPTSDNQYLLRRVKFAESGYVSICDGDEVKIYDGRTAKIIVSEDTVLKGWRFPHTKLWRIPLRFKAMELHMHTNLLNGPKGSASLNSLYTVPTSA